MAGSESDIARMRRNEDSNQPQGRTGSGAQYVKRGPGGPVQRSGPRTTKPYGRGGK